MEYDGVPITDFYPYREAARKLPGRNPGQRISERTLQRYRTQGVRRREGMIRLRALKIGSDWHTCDRWVEEFLRLINSDSAPAAPKGAATLAQTTSARVAARSPRRQERGAEAAKRELARMWERKQKT